MYKSPDLAQKIKERAAQKGVSVRAMLQELTLGQNTMPQLKRGQTISHRRLAKIADYLDCSVDYLLGRTDNPQSHKK